MTPDEIERQVREYRKKALEAFPLKLIEVPGDQAFSKWNDLKSAGMGAPVVLGGDDKWCSFDNLLTPFGPNGPHLPAPQPVEQILWGAASITFPDDLRKRRKADSDAALTQLKAELTANPNMPIPHIVETKDGTSRTYTRQETISAMQKQRTGPPIGEWPEEPSSPLELSVAYNILTGEPLSKVYLGLAPTDDWTTIPAYLRWGGWNDCPSAEYHVAAMRAWRDRYGAELVGISFDTINLRVATNPRTREEALSLARDQYVYCSDIIDQGVGTYSALAADLMANDWWYFWWD